MLPSTAIRLGDGTTIAWGFLGLDGSVSTVHVEVKLSRIEIGAIVQLILT